MKLFEWDDSLSVNIESIDLEHKTLLDMINNYYDEIHEIHNGTSEKSLTDLRVELISNMKYYATTHFKTEELFFEKYDYPEFKEHKQEHDDFVIKVLELEQRLESGELILTTELTDFLKEWLVDHIKGSDQKYSDYLVSKGAR